MNQVRGEQRSALTSQFMQGNGHGGHNPRPSDAIHAAAETCSRSRHPSEAEARGVVADAVDAALVQGVCCSGNAHNLGSGCRVFWTDHGQIAVNSAVNTACWCKMDHVGVGAGAHDIEVAQAFAADSRESRPRTGSMHSQRLRNYGCRGSAVAPQAGFGTPGRAGSPGEGPGRLFRHQEPYFGGAAVGAVRPKDLQGWLKWMVEERGDKESTAINRYETLAGVFSFAVANEYLLPARADQPAARETQDEEDHPPADAGGDRSDRAPSAWAVQAPGVAHGRLWAADRRGVRRDTPADRLRSGTHLRRSPDHAGRRERRAQNCRSEGHHEGTGTGPLHPAPQVA